MAPPQRHPGNQGVLRYLAQGGDPAQVAVAVAPDDVDTWRLGAHPDVVEWLWARLNGVLPADARFLVGDTAALVDPSSGLIVALALGTQYALRLGPRALGEARDAGYATLHEFTTVGRTLDLPATFGTGWVFGRHDAREAGWLAETVAGANR
ncbi:MAG TPA: hypothetical protein VF013_08915 [Candidatus Limnocylindria bacterium]